MKKSFLIKNLIIILFLGIEDTPYPNIPTNHQIHILNVIYYRKLRIFNPILTPYQFSKN